MTDEVLKVEGESNALSQLPRMAIDMSLEEYSNLMFAVGFLDGMSSFLWTKADDVDGISSEVVAFYDERVGLIRQVLSKAIPVNEGKGGELDD